MSEENVSRLHGKRDRDLIREVILMEAADRQAIEAIRQRRVTRARLAIAAAAARFHLTTERRQRREQRANSER